MGADGFMGEGGYVDVVDGDCSAVFGEHSEEGEGEGTFSTGGELDIGVLDGVA